MNPSGVGIMSLDQLKGSLGNGLMQSIHQKKKEKEKDTDPNNVYNQTNVQFLDTVASMKGFESEIGDIYICILFDLMLYKYPELN